MAPARGYKIGGRNLNAAERSKPIKHSPVIFPFERKLAEVEAELGFSEGSINLALNATNKSQKLASLAYAYIVRAARLNEHHTRAGLHQLLSSENFTSQKYKNFCGNVIEALVQAGALVPYKEKLTPHPEFLREKLGV